GGTRGDHRRRLRHAHRRAVRRTARDRKGRPLEAARHERDRRPPAADRTRPLAPRRYTRRADLHARAPGRDVRGGMPHGPDPRGRAEFRVHPRRIGNGCREDRRTSARRSDLRVMDEVPAATIAGGTASARDDEQPDFAYSPLLPIDGQGPSMRRLDIGGVETTVAEVAGTSRTFLTVAPQTLADLAEVAFTEVSHYLRTDHLASLRSIIDDPEASANDVFVALDLLQNASVSAGEILPMCQDTGTAIISAKRGPNVLTDGDDAKHLSAGIRRAYEELNLRYSQLAPLSLFEEKNTGTNLPAQIEIGLSPDDDYELLFMAKGGGSANKSFLYQESMLDFLAEKISTLGTAACPPYHLAVVIGGPSAEFTLKTAKLASAHYLDDLPTTGNAVTGHGFRDQEFEQTVFELTQNLGFGAQFGGKYFCHEVRVVRLPRHNGSLPIAIADSCSADRQIIARINADGVFIEELEHDPARFLPA